MSDKFLSIENLSIEYVTEGEVVSAVNGITLSMKKGETLGFKALLSGYRNSDGIFKDISDKAYFWSAEHFGSLAEYVGLLKISDSPLCLFESVHAACSVRAVFDA